MLELETLNELNNYFQVLYTISNALSELKGVHIFEIQYNTSCHSSYALINNEATSVMQNKPSSVKG